MEKDRTVTYGQIDLIQFVILELFVPLFFTAAAAVEC